MPAPSMESFRISIPLTGGTQDWRDMLLVHSFAGSDHKGCWTLQHPDAVLAQVVAVGREVLQRAATARELEMFPHQHILVDGYLPLRGRIPMLLRGPELLVSLPLLQWGSAWAPARLRGTPPRERGRRDPLWSRYSERCGLGSSGASFLGTSLGFSFCLRASALVAWEGCVALTAGEDLVGSRLAEMGQDLLLGGWLSPALSAVGEEEESTL